MNNTKVELVVRLVGIAIGVFIGLLLIKAFDVAMVTILK